ncbi:hypothetical protein ACTFQF_00100 [Aliivibrio fischeri]|uniref:hypothetical protein n=1 Tax=Aliivibrio fischeri TaxID=668 RepID=UPI003F776D4B
MNIKSLLYAALLFSSNIYANDKEPSELWSINPSNSCDSLTVTLPSPAIDYECDIDTTSGNPSTWFNPMASCSMDFDLIGLPSLGDIAAGLTGQVCSELNKIKDETIGDILGDINNQVPDNIFDGSIGSGGNSNNGNGLPNPNPIPTDPKDEMCYTQDSQGKNIIVPCSITDSKPSSPDTCYLKDGDALSDEWRKVKCSRPTVDYEMCVIGYEKEKGSNQIKRYSDGTPVPIVQSCKNLPSNSNLGSACYVNKPTLNQPDNKRPEECGRSGDDVTQYNRMCQMTTTTMTGQLTTEYMNCIEVDETCYGHLNKIFKAAACSVHTENFYSQSSQNDNSTQRNNPSSQGREIDDSWEW